MKYILINQDTKEEIKLIDKQIDFLRYNEYTHNANNEYHVSNKMFNRVKEVK